MASTVSASTLKVTITESITLNGSNQGATNTVSVSNVDEVFKRIITCPANNETRIADFHSSVADATITPFDVQDVVYIRFTNKDDTNFITLTFRNQDNDEAAIKVDAGQSFILNGDNANGMTAVLIATQDADAASSANFGALTNIQADADTASCDLEVFVACV